MAQGDSSIAIAVAAVAQIRSLAWELAYAVGAAKKEERKREVIYIDYWLDLCVWTTCFEVQVDVNLIKLMYTLARNWRQREALNFTCLIMNCLQWQFKGRISTCGLWVAKGNMGMVPGLCWKQKFPNGQRRRWKIARASLPHGLKSAMLHIPRISSPSIFWLFYHASFSKGWVWGSGRTENFSERVIKSYY